MPTQSRANPVPLLLTRPEPQATDFARALEARFGARLQIVLSPLLAPRFLTPELPGRAFAALILTSQTGVEAFQRLGTATGGLPRHAFCVGARTADAARQAGLLPTIVAPDAATLVDRIKTAPPTGALLHLRGRDVRGDLENGLNRAGIDTADCILYAQEQQQLSAEALKFLNAQSPVLVPLFSPRTAVIFAQELAKMNAAAPVFVAAMSDEVALEVATHAAIIKVAGTPDAVAMLVTVAMLLAEMQPA